MGIVNNAINPMAEDPQDTAFRQARLAEQAARDQVSIGQGGKAIAPVQDFTQPIAFYQNPSYLDTMWKMAHDGGTAMFPGGSGMNPQVQQGEAAQRGEFGRVLSLSDKARLIVFCQIEHTIARLSASVDDWAL